MTPTVQSLGIDRLSVADRIRLVEDIWDTIDADSAVVEEAAAEERSGEPPTWLKNLIDERFADRVTNPDDVVDGWAEAKARIIKRHARPGQ